MIGIAQLRELTKSQLEAELATATARELALANVVVTSANQGEWSSAASTVRMIRGVLASGDYAKKPKVAAASAPRPVAAAQPQASPPPPPQPSPAPTVNLFHSKAWLISTFGEEYPELCQAAAKDSSITGEKLFAQINTAITEVEAVGGRMMMSMIASGRITRDSAIARKKHQDDYAGKNGRLAQMRAAAAAVANGRNPQPPRAA